jgi:hypothetical protein
MNRNLLLATVSVLVATANSGAHPISLTNPSFEAPALTPGAFTPYSSDNAQNIPGWKTAGGWEGVQNSIGNYDSANPDGVNFAYNDGGAITQTVGTVRPGTYKLTVAIGSRADRSFAGGSLQLATGDTVLKSVPLTEPKKGTFQDETIEYTAGASDAGIGSPLTIKLVSDGKTPGHDGPVDFDNVRLDFISASPEPATTIHSITVDAPYIIVQPLKSSGDTWMPAWRADGSVVSPANDTGGFNMVGNSNINFNRIDGATPETLVGTTVNTMVAFGPGSGAGPDGSTWKSSGCLALDGAIYWFVGRHTYGETSGDKFKRQPAHNGSIIKSTDGGLRWTRPAQENYDHPMFPGTRFAAGYFIDYGQEGHEAVADGSDNYVYATSNNSFWDNGDDNILGRVKRSKIGNLDAKDWQYFTGGDGKSDANWSSDMTKAIPVISDADKLGMTGAVYLPKQKSYLMVCWYYPAGGGKMQDAHVTTTWNFRVAPHPWGPWRSVGTHTWTPEGFYCPNVCPKFTSSDGSRLWVFTAGDWTNGDAYRLHAVPISIQ